MNVYTLIRDLVGFVALFIIFPAFVFLPIEFFIILMFPVWIILLIAGIFLHLTKKKMVFDERMTRISATSHVYAMLITMIWGAVLIFVAKYFDIGWLTVPLAVYSIILVLVLTSRIFFEIMVRLPERE